MTADRIAAIRARLEAATPGPWKAEYDGEDVTGIVGNGSRIVETDAGYYPPRSGDADLIANAPEDLAWLLGEVERLEPYERLKTMLYRAIETLCAGEHEKDSPGGVTLVALATLAEAWEKAEGFATEKGRGRG